MKCPNCGFNLSKTKRETRVYKCEKEGFVRRNSALIEKEGASKTVIWLARQELHYSPRTMDVDIATSLMRMHKQMRESNMEGKKT
jgi:uncharacterized Zn finger protein